MNFLRLIRLLVLRSLKEEKFLTCLSVTGIALGIGLFVGVKAASDRALVSFEENIQGINPRTNYEIVHISGIDFHEDVYRHTRNIENDSFPVLQVNGYLQDRGVTIEINGLYTIKIAQFMKFSPEYTPNMELFFNETNAVLVTETFAERHDLKKGDRLNAHVYNRRYGFTIADVLDIAGLPPNTVVMDIGNFQEHFGKSGFLTKIDVSTDEATAERIRNMLPSDLSLDKKQTAILQQQSLVASFRYNLQFITFLAVLVGVFLLYNTIFISVIKRRAEIGIIRGLGTQRLAVVILFIVQGFILGFIGSLMGIVFGQLFSYFSVLAVEKTVSTIYRSISISDYLITGKDAMKSLGLGLAVSVLASVVPAVESARVRPNESSKAGSFEKKYKGQQGIFTAAGILCILSGGLIVFLEYVYLPFDFPYLAYVGILLFILGCTFNAPLLLLLVLRTIKKPAHRIFSAAGKVSINDIEGSSYRFSVALMSVAISSALIVALLSSIFSLKNSFRDWLHTYLVADVYVKPASCRSNYCFDPLPADVLQKIEGFPEVEDIGRFRALQTNFRGNKVIAGFGNTAIWSKYRKAVDLDREEEERLAVLGAGKKASVSDYLKIKYGLKIGDEIELQTPGGVERFTINYTSISFSTTSGFIYMDRKWLTELWGLDDATQLTVYLREGTDEEHFIEKLKRKLSGTYSLNITNNNELRKQSLAIFDKSFVLTYAIEIIAIIISLIGIINTLLILVFEKKREISIIRYLGGSWKHITKIMVLSAAIVGMAGILLGSIMGPAISLVIIHVINKISFGWEVSLQIPFLPLAVLMGILFLTTVTAGFIPSRVARKIDPKNFISFE